MAFKDGNQGYSHWPDLKKRGVAAITYIPLAHTDLSKYPKDEPRELWSRLKSSQKSSLSNLAFKMKLGDTIYVKDGTSIVGKGTIVSEYFFDDVEYLNAYVNTTKHKSLISSNLSVSFKADNRNGILINGFSYTDLYTSKHTYYDCKWSHDLLFKENHYILIKLISIGNSLNDHLK
jgi:hypothetical protein